MVVKRLRGYTRSKERKGRIPTVQLMGSNVDTNDKKSWHKSRQSLAANPRHLGLYIKNRIHYYMNTDIDICDLIILFLMFKEYFSLSESDPCPSTTSVLSVSLP